MGNDNDSLSDRERLKEEYKVHYRKIREIKERASRTKRTQNIMQALKDMDKSEMFDVFDDFLYSVKHKIALIEARLDVAMDHLLENEQQSFDEQQSIDRLRREKAKETLRQAKVEMGLLYKEIEHQADNLHVNKTIGNSEMNDMTDLKEKKSEQE